MVITAPLLHKDQNPSGRLSQALSSKIVVTDEMLDKKYEDHLSATDIIEDLPLYTPQKWVYISSKLHSGKLNRTENITEFELTIRYVISQIKGSFHINIYGQYVDVSNSVKAVDKLRYPGRAFSSKAFTVDPYERPFSRFEFFDQMSIASKWSTFNDGTLNPTVENLTHLRNVSQIVVSLTDLGNYMKPFNRFDELFNGFIFILSTCLKGGIGILKMPSPNTPRLRGLVLLFNSLFPTSMIMKFNTTPDDDPTVYLLGFGYTELQKDIIEKLLVPEFRNKILYTIQEKSEYIFEDYVNRHNEILEQSVDNIIGR